MMQIGSFINGRRISRQAPAKHLPMVNPVDEQSYGELIEADEQEVGDAVTVAKNTFVGGIWRQASTGERQRVLRNIAQHLAKHVDELAELECTDTGLPIQDIRDRHIPRMIKNFDYFADLIGTVTGDTIEQTAGYLTSVGSEPAGVAALIAPWNAPLALASMKVAGALSSGNSAVLKPSEHTPTALYRFVELLHEAGLPPGVLNLINGRGSVTGQALSLSQDVDRIAFTGGTETGRLVMQNAAQNLTPVMLELGGKSANIFFEDIDVQKAVDAALLGIFSNNGQQCLAGSRILVQKTLLDDFLTKFRSRCQSIKVGDPRDPSTEIGPLAFRSHYEQVLKSIELAKTEGELVAGGESVTGLDTGLYIQPTAFLLESNRCQTAQKEIFGPVACIIPFDTIDQAIEMSNESSYGLVAYAWTNNLQTAMRIKKEVQAGTIWINSPVMRELQAPFGGFKQSGVGRTGGLEGWKFFTETKSVCIATSHKDLPGIGRHD